MKEAPRSKKELEQRLAEIREREKRIREKMSRIKHKIAVISGKGGVGKSTVTSLLALTLATRGYKVGVFDSDFHGPSIPKMLGMEAAAATVTGGKIIPPEGPYGIKVISIYYFLPEPTTAVIWRGPLKRSFLEELLDRTEFGDIEFLLFDLPPGCVAGSCPVLTPSGAVDASSVRPGDTVLSVLPTIRGYEVVGLSLAEAAVKDVAYRGVERVYALRTRRAALLATPNHPVLALRHGSLSWVRLAALRPGDSVVVVEGGCGECSTWDLLSGRAGPFRLERVISVAPAGAAPVYDISVAGGECFVSGGLVAHNTGDEALNLVQVIPDLAGVIAVTQPTAVSAIAVAKALDFARKVNIRVIGVIENMSYFEPPEGGKTYKIFEGEGGEFLSTRFGVPLLGRVPVDPMVSEYGDKGLDALMMNPRLKIVQIFNSIVDKLLEVLGG